MSDTTTETFGFPAIGRKKLTAAFDGGRLTSDGGVMLLAAVERDMGIAEGFAGLIDDPRNPAFITHSVADILRARMLAIAVDTRMPTTSIICVAIRGSSWPVGTFLTAEPIYALSLRSRAGRMHPPCVK
jgi:hypothetical protein